MITIFTPTYNRAYILPKLYESLLKQISKNFEWIIVDDGSDDNTEKAISDFQTENLLKIVYKKQKNQGKHVAINTGLQLAHGDYFLVVDSDDYLKDHCVEVCEKLISKIDDKAGFAGFTFIRFSDKYAVDLSKYGGKEWVDDKIYDWEFPGEMNFCYKTKIAKQHLFPVFENEKFFPESLIHRRISRNYHVLFTDHVLEGGDYLEEGLSSKYAQLIEKNPRGALLSYREKVQDAKTFEQKKKYAMTYWNIAIKAKNISWMEKFLGINGLLSFYYWKERLFK